MRHPMLELDVLPRWGAAMLRPTNVVLLGRIVIDLVCEVGVEIWVGWT